MVWRHTHTTVLLLFWNMSGTTQVSRYQKGKTRKIKTNLDLLEQEIVSGSSICWAICKSAPHPRQPCQHPTTQFLHAGCPSCCPTNSVKALKADGMETVQVTPLSRTVLECASYCQQGYMGSETCCNNNSQFSAKGAFLTVHWL